MRAFSTKELLVLQERNLALRERIIKKARKLNLKDKRENKIHFELAFLSLHLQNDFQLYSELLKLKKGCQ